jgi:hypothetical protein
MMLNVGLDVSFDSVFNRKGMRENAGENYGLWKFPLSFHRTLRYLFS